MKLDLVYWKKNVWDKKNVTSEHRAYILTGWSQGNKNQNKKILIRYINGECQYLKSGKVTL